METYVCNRKRLCRIKEVFTKANKENKFTGENMEYCERSKK